MPKRRDELHFDATDCGQFYPDLVRVKDQVERAAAHNRFATGALRHPNIIDLHRLSYLDETIRVAFRYWRSSVRLSKHMPCDKVTPGAADEREKEFIIKSQVHGLF